MKMINWRMKEQQKFLLFLCLSLLFFSSLTLVQHCPLSLHHREEGKERKLLFTSSSHHLVVSSLSRPSHPIAFCAEFLLLFGIRFYCIFTFMTHLFCFLMTMMMVLKVERARASDSEEEEEAKDPGREATNDERGSFSTHFHGR